MPRAARNFEKSVSIWTKFLRNCQPPSKLSPPPSGARPPSYEKFFHPPPQAIFSKLASPPPQSKGGGETMTWPPPPEGGIYPPNYPLLAKMAKKWHFWAYIFRTALQILMIFAQMLEIDALSDLASVLCARKFSFVPQGGFTPQNAPFFAKIA